MFLKVLLVNIRFQFHEGPIKTSKSLIKRPAVLRFNSMKVRLKLLNVRCLCMSMPSFNSMKVRLKLTQATGGAHICEEFQFHEGPIKTSRFQSIIFKKWCFNSMKVRLKQFGRDDVHHPCAFQFHEGPIKTRWDLIYIYSTKVSIP